MPVQFRPPNFQWQIVADPEWDFDAWGLHRATLLYRGPRPGKKAAEDTIVGFASMPNFSGMRLLTYKSVNITPNFPGITAEYVGFRTTALPPAKETPSITAQSVRVVGKDNTSGKTYAATVAYRAPRSTWDWFETSTPSDTPRYATVSSKLNPLKSVDYMLIESTDGSTTVPVSAFTSIFNALVPVLVVDEYEPEVIVPNAIWHCKSVIDFRILGT